MIGSWLVGSLALSAAKIDHYVVRPTITAVFPVRAVVALYASTRGLFLKALSCGRFEPVQSPPGASRSVMGLVFRNDLGNAAGLDKDGVMLEWFWRSSAGFCVIGTVLDSPHTGNNWILGKYCPWLPLPSSGNGLNSLGLPSKGIQPALDNIADFRLAHTEAELQGFPIGISIMGHPRKHGQEKLDGVLHCVRAAWCVSWALVRGADWFGVVDFVMCGSAVADFIELNESCPNVKGHGKPSVEELEARLNAVIAARNDAAAAAGRSVPLLVKLGSLAALGDVETTVTLLAKCGCDGVIGLNTQTDYESFFDDMPAADVALLKEYTKHYNGGLSGPVILPRALSQVTEAKRVIAEKGLALTLVHCGGERLNHTPLLVRLPDTFLLLPWQESRTQKI